VPDRATSFHPTGAYLYVINELNHDRVWLPNAHRKGSTDDRPFPRTFRHARAQRRSWCTPPADLFAAQPQAEDHLLADAIVAYSIDLCTGD
jgi:hypothetical protein